MRSMTNKLQYPNFDFSSILKGLIIIEVQINSNGKRLRSVYIAKRIVAPGLLTRSFQPGFKIILHEQV